MKNMIQLDDNVLGMVSGGIARPPPPPQPPNAILNTASGKIMPDSAFDNGKGLFDNGNEGIGPFVLVCIP